MNKKIVFILVIISFISLFFNAYKHNSSPPCLNADEAAFSYNAYSILKTGKDEYGSLLPLRLKSFGDYKMPLYSYFSIPFVGALGLNETSARALNSLIAILFPLAVFFLAKELFKKNSISILAAFLTAVSLGLEVTGRHAHEAYLAAFLVTVSLIFLIKSLKKQTFKNFSFFFLFTALSLMAYHSNRILIAIFFLFSLLAAFTQKINKSFVIFFILLIMAFGLTDIAYNPTRVKNLLFFNNEGFKINIKQLKTEGGIKLYYNEIAQGIKEVTFQHLTYYSPQFFVIRGDENPRFGNENMSLLTPLEYIFIFIGLYYLFKKRQPWRFPLLVIFLVAPLSASLSWADISLTRSLFLLIPSILICAYGIINFLISIKETWPRLYIPTGVATAVIFLFFLGMSWDFYIFHYPKKGLTIRSWQCGYKELAQYIKDNNNKFDKFYITRKNGQPYIFLLFYLNYPPEKYQKQARLSPPDEYGFGQVEEFDKYVFSFKLDKEQRNTVTIGYPDDFPTNMAEYGIDESKIKKIKVGTEDMFWIYEYPKM